MSELNVKQVYIDWWEQEWEKIDCEEQTSISKNEPCGITLIRWAETVKSKEKYPCEYCPLLDGGTR